MFNRKVTNLNTGSSYKNTQLLSAPIGYFKVNESSMTLLPARKNKNLPLPSKNRLLPLSAGAAIFFLMLSTSGSNITRTVSDLSEGISTTHKVINFSYKFLTTPLARAIETTGSNLASVNISNKSLAATGSVNDETSFLSKVWNWFVMIWNSIVANWQRFLYGQTDQSNATITPAMASELRKMVTDEVNRSLEEAFSSAGTSSSRFGTIIIPSTGATATDDLAKKNLAQQFSDPVSIKFDKSGQAGVITPIFQDNRKRGNYIFLLTPVK